MVGTSLLGVFSWDVFVSFSCDLFLLISSLIILVPVLTKIFFTLPPKRFKILFILGFTFYDTLCYCQQVLVYNVILYDPSLFSSFFYLFILHDSKS